MPPDDPKQKNLDLLYSNLLKLYDLTLDRRKTLSGHATGLLSFTGIIQTVFLGLLITLATNAQARSTLLAGQNHAMIIGFLAAGFVTFMITISLALIAYFEQMWVPAPMTLTGTNEEEWGSQLDEYNKDPNTIPVDIYELQLMHGITYNNGINKSKYRILLFAHLFLAISLFLMAIVGFFIIAGIA